jgi:hypothetical protein
MSILCELPVYNTQFGVHKRLFSIIWGLDEKYTIPTVSDCVMVVGELYLDVLACPEITMNNSPLLTSVSNFSRLYLKLLSCNGLYFV